MNPNYDEMANPDDTYVDVSFGKDRSDWRLPEQKKNAKQKKTRRSGPVSDTMQNILLHLNTIPGTGAGLPAIEDVPFNGSQESYDDDFVERPSGPFPMILPNIPYRKFTASGIPDSELAAARRGQRWNWHNENSFMPPGSEWNKTVWQGADRENQWLGQLLRKGAAENGSMMSPIAKVRLRGQWLSERNKAIQDYINGNWDDPERAYKDFQSAIDKIDTKLRELGEDEALLRPVPPIAGKRSQFTAQTGPSKLRKQWNYANTVNNKLNEWLTTESKPGIKKINDPEFMGKSEVTTYLDSVYETLIKYLKESSNAMADAEKKRLQILTLTDEGHDAVVQTIKAYQKALAGVMSSASAKDWSQNNRGKVNEVIKAMGFDPDNMDKATLGQQMAALGGIIVSSLGKNDELPHDVRTDLEAIQEQYDKYMENMMFAANVAPHIVASMASALGETAGNQYNDQAFVAGRQLADNLGEIKDLTDAIPRNAVPMSKLLDPPQFIVPSLAKKPKGRVSTNPESIGENEPVNTASVPGVSFED